METQALTHNDRTILEVLPGEVCIASENDALDALAACSENQTDRLLLHAPNLDPAFFQLRSGLAGGVLLKLSNYRIRAALVAAPEQVSQGKFQDFMLETNRGRQFRIFYDRQAALDWLASLA